MSPDPSSPVPGLRAGPSRRRRGLSLAMVMICLLILSVLGLAVGAIGVQNLQQIRRTAEKTILLQAANGGLCELMDRLYNNPAMGFEVSDSSQDGEGTFQTSAGTVYYWWTFNRSGPAAYCYNNMGSATTRTGWRGMVVPPVSALLLVNADTVPKARSTKPVRLAAVASKKFRFAVASDGAMSVRNIEGVTGFPGSVWSNETGTNTVQATSIDGQVFVNSTEGAIKVQASPAGVPYYGSGTTPIPDIPIDQVVLSHDPEATSHPYGGPATLYSDGNVTIKFLSTGDFSVVSGNLSGPNGATFNASSGLVRPPPPGQPDLNIFIGGELRVQGGALLAPRMHFFVDGDMTVGGSLSQLPTTGLQDNFLFVDGSLTFNGGQASNLNLFVAGDLRQNGSANYKGVMYVKEGDFTVSGGGTGSNYEGAVIVKGTGTEGDLSANSANFEYNPATLDAMSRYSVDVSENSPVYTLSWWILNE